MTIYQLLLTMCVEIGLGVIAYVGFCKIIPTLKDRADQNVSHVKTIKTTPDPFAWILFPERYARGKSRIIIKSISKPAHFKTWIFYTFAQGAVFLLAQLLPTFILLTSIGWKLPFFKPNNLYYNFIFATANGQPNGAHITSYLSVMAIMLFVSWKTKDVFLGILSGALLVGIHELFWIIFYYAAWGQYLTFNMMTNILKDAIAFIPMLLLFLYAFEKYPYNYWKLRDFKIPILCYIIYLIGWFFIPYFFGYGFLPIRTANLPSNLTNATFTIYNETRFFSNPYVSGIEIISWVGLASMLMIIFMREHEHEGHN